MKENQREMGRGGLPSDALRGGLALIFIPFPDTGIPFPGSQISGLEGRRESRKKKPGGHSPLPAGGEDSQPAGRPSLLGAAVGARRHLWQAFCPQPAEAQCQRVLLPSLLFSLENAALLNHSLQSTHVPLAYWSTHKYSGLTRHQSLGKRGFVVK